MRYIAIERKNDNGKWVPFAELFTEIKPAFMVAYKHICENCVGDVVNVKHTVRDGKHVNYYKTTNTPGGFDFRETF